MAELYWLEALDEPFKLGDVPGVNFRRYDTVQDFAKFDHADEVAVFDCMSRTNARVLLAFLNRADLPEQLMTDRLR